LRGIPISLSLYQNGVAALVDDVEEVRNEGLRLIWILSMLYAERRIKLETGKTMRLIDDGFRKICNMVVDASPRVRAQACSLLGSMYKVKNHFLLQTLSKKILEKGSGKQVTLSHSRKAGIMGLGVMEVEDESTEPEVWYRIPFFWG